MQHNPSATEPEEHEAQPRVDVSWLPQAESLWSTFRVGLLALLQAWHGRLALWAKLLDGTTRESS